jgi:hypothetical protein
MSNKPSRYTLSEELSNLLVGFGKKAMENKKTYRQLNLGDNAVELQELKNPNAKRKGGKHTASRRISRHKRRVSRRKRNARK